MKNTTRSTLHPTWNHKPNVKQRHLCPSSAWVPQFHPTRNKPNMKQRHLWSFGGNFSRNSCRDCEPRMSLPGAATMLFHVGFGFIWGLRTSDLLPIKTPKNNTKIQSSQGLQVSFFQFFIFPLSSISFFVPFFSYVTLFFRIFFPRSPKTPKSNFTLICYFFDPMHLLSNKKQQIFYSSSFLEKWILLFPTFLPSRYCPFCLIV